MAQAAPFCPEMTHFTLPLHALREELIALLLRRWISLVLAMLAAGGTAVFDFGEGD